MITRLRRERGFHTVKALAVAAGVPQPTLHRYLSGEHHNMSVEHFVAVARALGVTVSELLGEVPLASAPVREVTQNLAQMTPDQQKQLARVSRALIEQD